MTSKKNTTTTYTPNIQVTGERVSQATQATQKSIFNLSTTQQVVQLAITIASVVIVLAGLWITTKLSPIAQDLALVKQAAAEDRRRVEDMRVELTIIRQNTDQTKNDVAEIKGALQGREQTK